MTCTEASIRYAGDYAYRKQVDAGTATAAKEVFAKVRPVKAKTKAPPRLRGPKAVEAPAPRAPKAPKAPKPPKAVKVPREPKVKVPKPPKPIPPHGTTQAQQRACKADCPNEETCTQKRTKAQRLVIARIRARGVPAHMHGTKTGYDYGCRKDSPCPGGPDGRTCIEVIKDYNRAVYRRRVDAA